MLEKVFLHRRKQAVFVTVRKSICISLRKERMQIIHASVSFNPKMNSFIEASQLASTSVLNDAYNIFVFESFCNRHLGIPNLLKGFIFKFYGSKRIVTTPGVVVEQKQPWCQVKVYIRRGVNSLDVEIDGVAGVPGQHVEFSCTVS